MEGRVNVRNVRGRHARQPRKLDGGNVEARVFEEARLVRIRIDDAENPEFWMEITLEVSDDPA